MRSLFLSYSYALALAFALAGAPHGPSTVSVASRPASSTPYDVIDAVNTLRASRGLSAYLVNSILMGTAQAQADFMAASGIVDHAGPGGTRPYQRALAAGYPLSGQIPPGFFSENIQAGSDLGAEAAVRIWTGDALHMATMTSPMLQDIGAGIAEQGGMVYYVIDCARPTNSSLPQAYTPGAEAQFSGSNVIVPVAASTPNVQGDIIHEVKAGQSLWQIAVTYGVKIDEIRQLNHLSAGYMIQPGDKLLIKRVPMPTSVAPTMLEAASALPPLSVAPLRTVAIFTTEPASITPSPGVQAPDPWGAAPALGAIIATALVAAGFVAWAGRQRSV